MDSVCLDYYDEALVVGDRVTSVVVDLKTVVDDSGIITKIWYNPKDEAYYLNIRNELGYTLTKRNAKWYTTKERYEKYNPSEYTYFLDLDYLAHWRYEKVLDNFTHPRIDFPASSFMVVLYARYKTEIYDEYEFIPKFAFIIDKDITIDEDGYLLYKSFDDGQKYRLGLFFPYRLFQSREELLAYLGELIKYFKSANLTMWDNFMSFKDNKEAQKFDDELMRKLQK